MQLMKLRNLEFNQSQGLLVSGSATPSIKEYYEALNEKKHLIKLNQRFNDMQVPKLEVIDMRQELY